MDHLERIVKIANSLSFDEIPYNVLDASKKDILDTLGCILAGVNAEGTNELLQIISDWGGKKESTILYHGIKVPAPFATLVNSTMAHARDFDDTHDEAVLHAGVSIIPAALAAAERAGECDGKLFLKAVTLGLDFLCRLGKATKIGATEIGLVYTSTFAYFASALTAGLILKLNDEQLMNAIGITMSQVAGTVQAVSDAALTKRIQPAFGAQAGVTAAILAKQGITGARNVFNGKFSFPKVYLNDHFDYDLLIDSYGENFESENLSFKPYPCCRFTHPAIDAALQLREETNMNPEDIVEISVDVTTHANVVCEPVERRKKPQVVVDAQFSIPYTVAVALVKGKVFVEDFTETAIADQRILNIASRVITRYDNSLAGRGISPAIVTIVTKDRNVHRRRVDHPLGSIENSMSFEEIVDKFKKCSKLTPNEIPEKNINEVIRRIGELEKENNITEFTNLLTLNSF
ncbi:MmgE/PrpD family protein [Bacillus sp. OK048]|uniref:MmgE/PrpD family protein n=1 Tax=Bacillus sp. OK048 TaxID=1882761 RepID=UPI0008868F1E|nr:MmgE/PrpD family protein [Bacillus sp. OK048]SDL96277.1 2-methylcitrate dehydratase PrpD [Bacillus sp. OK048]